MSNPVAAQTFVKSPEVHADGKVTFRLHAPKAKKVTLSAGKLSGSMKKNDDGIWTLSVGPLESNTYEYSFNVDGATVLDPVNRSSKAWFWMQNMVDVVGDTPAGHQVQNVPHGELHLHFYHSEQMDKQRRFFVYTPPGYATSKESYPVLYLLHGFGDDESAWPEVGMANNVLDNVLAEKNSKPFIVVMPFGHESFPASPDYEAYDLETNAQRIEKELIGDILPRVEKRYRCLTNRTSRGIAGLSMGGGQSIRIGLANTNLFGWITGYSSSIDKLGCNPALENHLAAIVKDKPKLSLMCGTSDFLYDENVVFQKKLTELNVKYHHQWTDGGHTWENWRMYLAETAKTIFND